MTVIHELTFLKSAPTASLHPKGAFPQGAPHGHFLGKADTFPQGAPQGHFLGKADTFPQGAKLVNIPDIHCVLRLGDRSRHRPTSSIHGVVAFGTLFSWLITQTCSEAP
jgi:hypothetical protein